ncbi:hypothetical protein BHF71_03340 [Vulcanibacillus modesticaldus]|uniref:Uncharacterized protein n=1 Tax=Vulcanibacillus modesticaldus TaxID=337097 RepID=A0A1D2YST2_9BACI|nr:phosphotransferase [Vulcanibacillus modesticaldus]OEF98067.1 hypothetical protein BHF71_03340 [Vulcanibacillus modesticaldus]
MNSINVLNNMNLVEVLRQYELRVATIETYPSFYKLKTDRGTKILKKWNDIDTLKEVFRFKESLAKAGFRKIDRLIRTKEGKPFVLYEGHGYALTDWIDGKKPSIFDEEDLKILGTTLGNFNLATAKININHQIAPWSEHFFRGLKHLQYVERYLDNKSDKNDLDEIILKDIVKLNEQVDRSIQMARKIEKTSFRIGIEPKLCHGNLYSESFKIDEYKEGWIVDLGLPIIDIPVYDIAKLVIRIYKESGFKDEIIYQFLNHYQSVKPLQKEEKYWILTYIAYPHNIWKFLYVYYVAKIPHPTENLSQYKKLMDEQINLGKLYQLLFTYFDL